MGIWKMNIPPGGSSCPLFLCRIGIQNVDLCGAEETRGTRPGEKPSEQGRELATNSTHM